MTMVEAIKPRAMRDTLLQSVHEQMQADDKIFFTTADFGSPVLDKIREDFPKRFVNVGIAEQNLINVSAGLALEGFKVFAYAIAPFITMRCFEQIRVNLGLLSEVRPMNVNLIGVGAGYSYVVSGPTHQCYEDITLMRAMPNMRVISLADQQISAAMPKFCLDNPGLKYLRLDAQVLPVVYGESLPDLNDGFAVHHSGKKLCLLATGYLLHTALKASEVLGGRGYSVGVIDLFDLSRFNEAKLLNALSDYDTVVTMEEGFVGRGGMDAMMFNFMAGSNTTKRIVNMGVEGGYRFEIGERNSLHEQVGIGLNSVVSKVSQLLG